MSKEIAIENTAKDCTTIITRTAEMIEDFIAGKCPEKYGSTQLAKDLADETGMSLSLVAPIVSLFIKNDTRVKSNKGRYNGGLHVVGVDEVK